MTHQLKKLPSRYQIRLPANDAIQFVPLEKTPDIITSNPKVFGFYQGIQPIDNGPSIVYNRAAYDVYIQVVNFLGPYGATKSKVQDIYSMHYLKYRRLFLNTNLWPDFNLAYQNREFFQEEPTFRLVLTVDIQAKNLDEAMRKAREHTSFLKFDKLTIEVKA